MTEKQEEMSLKEAAQCLLGYWPRPFAIRIMSALADMTEAREKIVKRVQALEEEKKRGIHSFYDTQGILNILCGILHDLKKAGIHELKRPRAKLNKIGQEW